MNDEIILFARSKAGESDWYGDYNYEDNPLKHYVNDSKLWKSKVEYGGGHGYGIESITVYTTEEAIRLMGWEKDLKYKK